MSAGTSSGSKPRLDIFIPKKLKMQRSELNGGAGAKTTATAGQSSPAVAKPESTRETAQDGMNHNTVQMAHPANSCATNQLLDELVDKEWTKDQLRLLHKTLTQKLRRADMRSKVIARAGSGTAVLQNSSSSESLRVAQLPRLPQHSGRAFNHRTGKTDCSAATGPADTKTGTVAADTAANGDITSLITASMSPSSQDSAAHSTGCMSLGDSHRSEPFTSDSSPIGVQHRRSISLSSGQHHPKQISDKPARSQRSHKSCRRSTSPEQSRRQTAEHGTQHTGQSSPARKHGRSSSTAKNSSGKQSGSSISPARASQALAPTASQSPARPNVSAAKHFGSSKPQRRTRGRLRIRRNRPRARRHRSPSRSRSPYLGNRAERIFARPRSPYFAASRFVDTSLMERQRYAEGVRSSPSRLQALTHRTCCGLSLIICKLHHIMAATRNHIASVAMPCCGSKGLHSVSHSTSQ